MEHEDIATGKGATIECIGSGAVNVRDIGATTTSFVFKFRFIFRVNLSIFALALVSSLSFDFCS